MILCAFLQASQGTDYRRSRALTRSQEATAGIPMRGNGGLNYSDGNGNKEKQRKTQNMWGWLQHLLTDGRDVGDKDPEQLSIAPRSLNESLFVKLKLQVCF